MWLRSFMLSTYLPSFGAFPWEFGKNNLLFRMLLFVFFTTGLHKECISCHTTSWLTICMFTTSHLYRCSWLNLMQMLIVLIILLMILLDLMFLYMLILFIKEKKEGKYSINHMYLTKKKVKKEIVKKVYSESSPKKKKLPTKCVNNKTGDLVM